MSAREDLLGAGVPAGTGEIVFPRQRRDHYHPSPVDWRDEVLYFLLPDRFSDGGEDPANLLDHSALAAARPPGFCLDGWARSGGDRWQGGTLKGVQSKLDYLQQLGVSALWIGPVFQQRGHQDGTYHGYGIQHFLEVEPHLGSREDLVQLVDAAHGAGIRVILDLVFNHSGCNWLYPDGAREAPYLDWPRYHAGELRWLDRTGEPCEGAFGPDDAVWPRELQASDNYTRAGTSATGGDEIDDPHAPMRRADFYSLRDFNFEGTDTLQALIACYKYWIALADVDGFRIDTLKHVPLEAARNFCGGIREYAENLGKSNFLLLGEVAGRDENPVRYLDVLGHNLSATLDINSMRPTLAAVAKGLTAPEQYFGYAQRWDHSLGSHRDAGSLHVSIVDDHDHVCGDKARFSRGAGPHQVAAAVAIQLFSLGLPCLYYGTEQAFAGPEEGDWTRARRDFGDDPRYLREAMFGPAHPRRSGLAGLQPGADGLDTALPGFGPFGTAGKHCFDPTHPVFARLAHLTRVRRQYPVLRYGRQYQRQLAVFGSDFAYPPPGELIAWSRLLDDEEALIVVNGHGHERRGGKVVVSAELHPTDGQPLQVVGNTEEAATGAPGNSRFALGAGVPVHVEGGMAWVEVADLGPSETLVLVSHP